MNGGPSQLDTWLPTPSPLPWDGKCVWSRGQHLTTMSFILFFYGPRAGQGQVRAQHRRWGGGQTCTSRSSVWSPLHCITPGAPELCPCYQASIPHRDGRRQGQGSWFWGHTLRGPVTPVPLIQGPQDTHVLGSLSPGA